MISVFNTVIYGPLYNGLIFLIDVLPYHDVGLAVISLTLAVKIILSPLAKKGILAQKAVAEIEPEAAKIRDTHKDDKQEQAKRLMSLYKERGVSPFSGFLTILVQIPIIIALYLVFARAGLPEVMSDLLYSFVPTPENINMIFLGLVDMAAKSWPLAFLAGATQFFQAKVSSPPLPPKSDKPNFKDDFGRRMQIQIRYILPVAVIFISHSLSSAVALYWAAGNIFGIAQEFLIRRHQKVNGLAGKV